MKIAIFGAGSIGVYVGVSLLAAGADAVLIGRPRMHARIASEGVRLTDLRGADLEVDAGRIPYSEGADALKDASLILVTVKSADTVAAAAAICAHARSDALVISLQNGVGNTDVLRAALPGRSVLAGMVPFNVVQMPGNRFHRGTEGELMVEASPRLAPWLDLFRNAGLPLLERDDFTPVQWGKLLLNLNNPINALSGLPLKAELSQHAYRRCLALLIGEALAVLKAAGIRPAKVARVAPGLLPVLLRLPDFLFLRVAGAMLDIDPQARSSMWEDLQAGRRTEVDYLNGAVAHLAQAHGRTAPLNARIAALIREAEQGNGRRFSGSELLAALQTGTGQPDGASRVGR
ncbi:2-dehydropantoate 2-reductase [Noviherbaspirillum sp. CPCC 100848]|uniref:2-dehydropantoate 2-reductase n=1 Tax=Noviherbaspirillum album TaxID=3080276 RepID=A0ABU6J7M4_9BURK|nr:2-dehydropantoate 2-reductase [Noviherbaspirillum sp. CPCC 100848]MEC4719645.1 2-dehydropantoate 2-reductase [Noviherbaspirillum sp. CPCC 100848]